MNQPMDDLLRSVRTRLLDYVDRAARPFDPESSRALHDDLRQWLLSLDDSALARIASDAANPGRLEEAVRICSAVAQLAPGRPGTLFAKGLALQFAGRHAQAIEPYREALALDPDWPSLRNNLAAALLDANAADTEGKQLLETAVAHDPGDVHAWTNLTRVRPDDTDVSRALAAGERAVALAPNDPLALRALGLVLKEAQQWDAAEQTFRAGCRIAPNDATERFNLALVQLARGNYREGWPGHELRWQGSRELRGGRPVFPKPAWQGEPLAGRTLLVWGEQGMGDLLQFSRYVPLLADHVHRAGGRLVWNSFPQMGALLERSLGNHCDLYCAGGPVESFPPYDFEVSLLSLPLIFGTQEDTIPGPVGYLTPDPEAAARWRARLGGESRLKVGLAWTGSLTHQRNPFRRIGLDRLAAHLAPLLSDVAFYSLQPGAQADVAAVRAAGLEICDFSAEWTTFDDTAAFMAGLDLVISVCTSMAHLAGALGKREWVLLDVNPHWMWQLERRDSPWYPQATLYRQKAFRQWEPVLEEVARDLAQLARERFDASRC